MTHLLAGSRVYVLLYTYIVCVVNFEIEKRARARGITRGIMSYVIFKLYIARPDIYTLL